MTEARARQAAQRACITAALAVLGLILLALAAIFPPANAQGIDGIAEAPVAARTIAKQPARAFNDATAMAVSAFE